MSESTEQSPATSVVVKSTVALESYLATASHDLRTPLTAILGYAELLLSEHCSAVDRMEFANTIRRSGEEIQLLANRLFTDLDPNRATLTSETARAIFSADPAPFERPNEGATSMPGRAGSPLPTPPSPEPTPAASVPSLASVPFKSEVPVTAGPAFESVACGLTPSAFDSTAATSYGGVARMSGSVLVVEDSKDNQRLIVYFLRHFGLDFVLAENGAIALEMANAAVAAGRPFDLVLMDIGMPVMDGLQATAAMRAAGMTMPIVALTAHALAGDRERCLSAGCSDYISKPIERSTLASTLTRYLSRPHGGEASGVVPSDGGAPIQSNLVSRECMQRLPAVVARARDTSSNANDAALRQALSQLRECTTELGLCQAASLAAVAESTLRLGADRSIIRRAVDEAIACARRTDGYDAEREQIAA